MLAAMALTLTLQLAPAVDDPSQLSKMIADAKVGSTATVKVLRNGRSMELKLPIVSSSSQSRGRR